MSVAHSDFRGRGQGVEFDSHGAEPYGSENCSSDGDEEADTRNDVDGSEEVFAFVCCRNRVGFARYHEQMCQITCGEMTALLDREDEMPVVYSDDVPEDLCWLEQLFRASRPKVALFPSAGAQILVDIAFLCDVPVLLVSPGEADEVKAYEQLQELWPEMSVRQWHGRLNKNHRVMMMAVSIILHFARRHSCGVADVCECAPLNVLSIDRSTIDGLQIVRLEDHPCAYQGIGRAKDGLSLFTLVDRTLSGLGRKLMRQWFLMPSSSCIEITQRLDVVAFFAKSENLECFRGVRRALRLIKSPGRALTAIRAARHRVCDYATISKCSRGFLTLADALLPHAHLYPCFGRLVASCMRVELGSIIGKIASCVDLRVASLQKRNAPLDSSRGYVPIRKGVDAVLDELREHYAGMNGMLTAAAQKVAETVPVTVCFQTATFHCAFVPQYGYVTVLNMSEGDVSEAAKDTAVPSRDDCLSDARQGDDETPTDEFTRITMLLRGLEGWELVGQTGGALLFKNAVMRELDDEVGDLRLAIADREGEVQRVLDAQLLQLSPALIPVNLVGEVDCLSSFAVCAIEEGWCRPIVLEAEEGVVEIDNGYYPLLVWATSQVIPFSVRIRSVQERVCIVTGANGSGKSVFLSGVATIVFLAHIGCFVPASSATISVFHCIASCHGGSSLEYENGFGRSRRTTSFSHRRRKPRQAGPRSASGAPPADGCEQLSVPEQLSFFPEAHSSFGQELTCVSRMLQRSTCTNRALFVLDEFGKGTLAMDGIALLAGSVQCMIELGERRPVVLLCTHYTELLDDARLIPLSEVQWLQSITQLVPLSTHAKGDPKERSTTQLDGQMESLPRGEQDAMEAQNELYMEELVSLFQFEKMDCERLLSARRADGSEKSAWELQQHFPLYARCEGGSGDDEAAMLSLPLSNSLRCALGGCIPLPVIARAHELVCQSLQGGGTQIHSSRLCREDDCITTESDQVAPSNRTNSEIRETLNVER